MKRPEQILQTEAFKILTPLMVLQKYKQFIAFQVRNETGVKNGTVLGGIAKSMGTMAGVSDTIFLFPNKIIFVEFKAYKPLKTKKRDPESLLSDEQIRFRDRVTSLGFEYRIIAAKDINDMANQIYSLLRENGVKC